MSDDAQHLARLKETYERRLKILEQQAATFGISAPPHIQAIGAGRTIPQAFEPGTVQIRLHGIEEHLTPVPIEKKG